MNRFYTPYRFIPVDTRRAHKREWRQRRDLEDESNAFVRHDRWSAGGLSGRITCVLHCRTPLVAGAEQSEGSRDRPGAVRPYRHPDGTLSIPGNSLRGMIASVAEAISQSALRVLSGEEESCWSVRKRPAHALRELGILLRTADGWQLLVLPENERLSIRLGGLGNQQTYQHSDNRELLHVELDSNGRFRRFADTAGSDTRTGILLRRGWHDKMPNKKKELFILWNGETGDLERLRVDNAVVETFEQILRARHEELGEEDDFPILPVGYEGRDWEQPVVRSGDLVWFRRNGDRVVELSYSAIWRKRVPGTLHEAFQRSGGDDALPWNPARNHLTPAEALFGAVEEQPKEHRNTRSLNARNLASRLRFLDASPENGAIPDKPVTLKILASPKPPSPAMYFAAASGHYISKEDLDLREHAPNGRKFYPPTAGGEATHWESRIEDPNHNWKPHLRVSPIPEKSRFRFRIEFENLSEGELALLCTALQPGKGFVHRLGLGKPLGLGQVEITIRKLELIDRTTRYSPEGLDAPRYRKGEIPSDPGPLVEKGALELLRQLGTPASYEPELPVCYPYTTEQGPYSESEGYKWFVENDKKNGPQQYLEKAEAGQPPPSLKPNRET